MTKTNGGETDRCEENRVWLFLASALGLTMIISFVLDRSLAGIPFEFDIPLLNEPATVSSIVYHAAVIGAGGYIGVMGLKELAVERRFSVEFLMAIAAIGAVCLNYLFEGATVLFLYSLAEHFEGYIEDRARRTVEKLSEYMPETARVIEPGPERAVNVKEIKPGTTIVVRPGERIPLDGQIVDGATYVDQSIVTGESLPLLKEENDPVYAGTLNTNGLIRIAVTKAAEQTLVSRIVKLVMESRRRKASIERLVDRFSRIYVPMVVLLAFFTAIVPPRILGGDSQVWLYRSLIFLVVSCPSAFVVSVPATIFTAITVAARKGAIIKGGIYVEKMAQVKAVVFDKTGTLTLGKPAVIEVSTFAQNLDRNVLSYVAALEQHSNHPMAEALVRAATEQRVDFLKLHVQDLKEIPGKGLIGLVEGTEVAIGNKELMKGFSSNHLDFPDTIDEKHTCVFVAINRSIVSAYCLADDVRTGASEAVNALRSNGIHTAVLTGDRGSIAKEIADRLKADEMYAELLPEEKLRIVGELKARHGLVAMVGDGVNDAPALAASDVGIAMGGSGVDVALESADVVLVKDELGMVPYLYRLSNLAVRISRQNIAASLLIKLALGALGFLGLAPLWFAVAAGDDGLTMVVLLNTLRLVKLRNP